MSTKGARFGAPFLFTILAVLLAAALAFAVQTDAEPRVVQATVKVKYKKKHPRIDRSPARIAFEGQREKPTTVAVTVGAVPWPERMTQLGVSPHAPRRLRLSKREHTLELIAGGQVVGLYPVGFGRNAINDKLREGDRTTPEGVFRIASKHPSAKNYLSLCLDYPNAASLKKRERARGLGLDVGTSPGGDICIHGHGIWGGNTFYEEDGAYYVVNWTRGCATLNDEMMKEVYDFARGGDTVEIVWTSAPAASPDTPGPSAAE